MVYSDDLCDADKKPELERECEKAKNCDFQWFTSQWSKVKNKKEKDNIFMFIIFFLKRIPLSGLIKNNVNYIL